VPVRYVELVPRSSALAPLRGRLTPAAPRWVNRASGAAVVGFGLAALLDPG